MEKEIVLVDIDGTISKVGDRLRYLEQKPKDWDSFYEACGEDEPIDEIIRLVRNLAEIGLIIKLYFVQEGVNLLGKKQLNGCLNIVLEDKIQ